MTTSMLLLSGLRSVLLLALAIYIWFCTPWPVALALTLCLGHLDSAAWTALAKVRGE